MSLIADIGQGAGLAGATGVRPFLPPLLAGALAREDLGIDFDRTDWRFLESTGFLLAVFALAALSYGAERSRANRSAARASDTAGAAVGDDAARPPLAWAFAAVGVLLGALLFAGTLAEGGHAAWPGALAGAGCAALAYLAAGGLFDRARARLEAGAAALIVVYAEALALSLALVAVLVPVASFAAIAGFVFLLVVGRAPGQRKYAGLRILR